VIAERTDAERGKKNKEVVRGACNKQDSQSHEPVQLPLKNHSRLKEKLLTVDG
jgi:hypothetical protein